MPHLLFDGKNEAFRRHISIAGAKLHERSELSIAGTPVLHRIIEGENLAVMRTLLDWGERFDRVYLDPPYNTGNAVRGTWVYDDTGRLSTKDPDDIDAPSRVIDNPTDAMLSRLAPRLCAARELLASDGVLFLSAAERELELHALLCAEVFGLENRLAVMSIRSLHTVRNSSKGFSRNTEHVICYAKDARSLTQHDDKSSYLRVPSTKEANYPYDDDDGKGPYRLDQLYARNYAVPYRYRFKDGREWEAPVGTFPRYTQEELRRREASGEIVWSRGSPRAKRYLNQVAPGEPPSCFPAQHLSGFSKDGTAELSELFDGQRIFNQPKPRALLRYLYQIERERDRGDRRLRFLDCYAGSGTSLDVIMGLNAEDNGNRSCTLIQTGTRDTGGIRNLCREITRERVVRARSRFGYPDGFRYYTAELS